MASFAKIGMDGRVLEVVSVANEVLLDDAGNEQEVLGINFLEELSNWPCWKQTSYNTYHGEHLLGGTPLRKNYAGIDFKYDTDRQAFIPPKPYLSWTLNETTCDWDPPIERPTEGGPYIWNEKTQQWDVDTQ
tara:strand:- start:1043 stop:1438 length:396 start_codon:yes stop_codon:yes gene_type:complete